MLEKRFKVVIVLSQNVNVLSQKLVLAHSFPIFWLFLSYPLLNLLSPVLYLGRDLFGFWRFYLHPPSRRNSRPLIQVGTEVSRAWREGMKQLILQTSGNFPRRGEWLTWISPRAPAISALLFGGQSPPDVDTFVEGYRARLQGWATRQGPHLNVSGSTFQASWMSDVTLLNIYTLNSSGWEGWSPIILEWS